MSTPTDLVMTVLCNLVVGPLVGKIVGHSLAYVLISQSQDLPVAFVVSVTSVVASWSLSENFFYHSGVTTVISMALTTSAHSASTIHNPIVIKKCVD